MPTKFYTLERAKKGSIEKCPACGKKGKIHRYPHFDQYVHSVEYSDSRLFRHIKDEVKCDVPNEKKKEFYEYVKAMVVQVIDKMDSDTSWKIVKMFHEGSTPEQAIMDILSPYAERLKKQIESRQKTLLTCEAVMNQVIEDSCAS